jgi:hypothetical protein
MLPEKSDTLEKQEEIQKAENELKALREKRK